jgi:transmembrane sensor
MTETAPPANDATLSERARAEAAIWIARLHDEQRSPDLDSRIQTWLAESEVHRQAFERLTRVWEDSGALQMRATLAAAPRVGSEDKRYRIPLRGWLPPLFASILLAVGVGAVRLWSSNSIVTGVGQQQVRLLPDGTRLMLNTDTRLEVLYDSHTRRIRLIRGEASFDVARQPAWPFVVSVDGREIRALGTSFIVRHDAPQTFSVTLVEGRISVSDAPQAMLAAGERLQLSKSAPAIVDRPEIARLTAWEQGRVEFEDTPLVDAAAEMNRYSTKRVVVDDAVAAKLRIGGVFRAGDSEEFVRIAAVALGLQVEHRRGELRLRSAIPPS